MAKNSDNLFEIGKILLVYDAIYKIIIRMDKKYRDSPYVKKYFDSFKIDLPDKSSKLTPNDSAT